MEPEISVFGLKENLNEKRPNLKDKKRFFHKIEEKDFSKMIKFQSSLEIREAKGKNYGVFTKKNIKKFQFVTYFAGTLTKVLPPYSDPLREYTMEFHELEKNTMWFAQPELWCSSNSRIPKYPYQAYGEILNHSCSPNMICVKLRTTSQLFLGFQALIDIKANEELTFDYEWTDDGKGPLTLCYCGSPNCHNYIQKRDENVKSEIPDYLRISEIFNQPKVLKNLKY